MRVTILAMGSRGDVEPFLALAQGLIGAGHRVRLATHAEFAALAGEAGVPLAPLPGRPRENLESADGQAILRTRNLLALPARLARLLVPGLAEAAPAAERACADADVVVASTLAYLGPTAAEAAGARLVWAHLQPATATATFSSPMVPLPSDAPAAVNRLTWALPERLMWRAFRPVLQERRRALGLPPLPTGWPSRWPTPVLYGYSPRVVPVPPDWAGDLTVTGYWARSQPDWPPPPELERFLAAGPPPVYLGFGSIPVRHPPGLVETLLSGLRAAGLRAVLSAGWAGFRPPGPAEDVLAVGEVPHDWLFPRMAAVLHHGGAGTTAAGLRAGVPAVVVPVFADQSFWGRRVHALGVGPPPVPPRRLTASTVAEALRTAATDPRLRSAARELGRELAAEDGVGAAVAVLERVGAVEPHQPAGPGR